MLLLAACVATPPSGAPTPGEDTGDTDTGNTGDTDTADTHTGDSSPGPLLFVCPADMAPVPADDPAWCIDPYEVTVVDGLAASVPGVVPTVGITYEEAVAACAATPAVDDFGEAYAMRQLATSAEWEDAGDGVVGEGGTAFPWGDSFDETRCVTPTATGTLQFDALQPTGSMAGCVSAFGVYDQVGNAWEWTDSGRTLDAASALDAFATAGFTFTEDTAGLVLAGGAADALLLEAAGVQPPTVTVADGGYLEVAAAQVQPDPASFFARGYLGATTVDAPLAIRLVQTGTGGPWRVFVAREYDGRAIPDKRGCAWYTGSNQGCALAVPSYTHLPDFDGTIGFRCVAPPYAR